MIGYKPHNLDLNELVRRNPPENIKNFHIDKLASVGTTIATMPKDENGWADIYSKVFQRNVHDYKSYLDYFEETNVIDINKQFQHNEWVSQVRRYKFSDDYDTTLDSVDINYLPILKKDAKISAIPTSVSRNYHHLTKFLNPKLSIDLPLLLDYWNFSYCEDLNDYQRALSIYDQIQNTWYESYDEKKIALNLNKPKNPVYRYNQGFIYANDLEDSKYHCSLGTNSNRLTTIFTLMPKECRKFIKYDGRNLCEIDISNSVPYLFLALLNPEFWEKQRSNLSTSFLPSSLLKSSPSPSILVESLQNIDNKEIRAYTELVISGELYSFLEQPIRSQTGYEFISKKQLKQEVLRTFFSGNQFLNSLEAGPKRVFAETFPTIYNFLTVLKRHSKEFLANLLMRIESHLILDIISKRIAKEYPRIPVFTIHDCIATFAGEEDLITRIASEELEKFIGFPPRLKSKQLNITKLKYNKQWKASQ